MIRRVLRLAGRVAEKLSVEAMYVVGSRARGGYPDESGMDVVIVACGVRKLDVGERLTLLACVAEPGVDYLVYDAEEWEMRGDSLDQETQKESQEATSRTAGFLNPRPPAPKAGTYKPLSH